MSTVAPRPLSDDLASLDRFLAADALWTERQEQGRALAEHLLHTTAPIVVLHGPAQSGRTELIDRWVIPRLTECGVRVSRRTPDLPTGAPETIHFWDDFDRALGECTPADLDRIVRSLAPFIAMAGSKVVLVIREDHLSRLFRLGAAVPEVLADVREISPGDPSALLRALPRITAPYGIAVPEETLDALSADLSAFRSRIPAHPELLGILAFELSRMQPPDGYISREVYASLGGMTGLLDSHLDFLIQNAPGYPDLQVGRAVLQEVAKGQRGEPSDLAGIAARFECAPDLPEGLLRWLTQERRILRTTSSGHPAVVHPELLAVIEAGTQRDAQGTGWIRSTLRQGIRQFAETEALPSEANFRRIHAHRAAFPVSEEEAQLMLRCAIAFGRGDMQGATAYWLRRTRDADAKVDILLAALFDLQPDVRRRAAVALKAFPRPEVRTALHLLALRDAADAVREAAVDSLAASKDEALRDTLIDEIRQADSPYRHHAIDALRLFDDELAVAALGWIVGQNYPGEDRAARLRAIAVLGLQRTRPATDTLLNVALTDPDADDRDGAARALGALTDRALVRLVLERSREWEPPGHRTDATREQVLARRLTCAALAVATALATCVVHGLVLALQRRWRLAAVLTATGLVPVVAVFLPTSLPVAFSSLWWAVSLGAGLLVPLRRLLLERRERGPRDTFTSSLAIALFAVASLSYFLLVHGLASLLTKDYRRGLSLIGCQASGLVMLAGAVYLMYGFAAFAQVSTVVSLATVTLQAGGLLVIASTYLYGIFVVVRDVFVRRHERMMRLAAVYLHLVRSPVAADVLIEQLEHGSPAEQHHAAQVVTQYEKEMHTSICAAWSCASPQLRRRLFDVLAAQRDFTAIDFLKRVAPTLGWPARLRSGWSIWAFRLSIWPRGMLTIFAILLMTLVCLGAAHYAKDRNLPDNLAARFQPGATAETRSRVVNTLETLASQQLDLSTAESAARGLSGLLTTAAAKSDSGARADLIEASARLSAAPSAAKDSTHPPNLARLFPVAASPQERRRIVDVLETFASHRHDLVIAQAAALQLNELLLSGPAERDLNARVTIVEAIARTAASVTMPVTVDPVDALATQLAFAETQSPAVDALANIGTAKAAMKLREFVERSRRLSRDSPENRQFRQIGAHNRSDAARRALLKLSVMVNAGDEPFKALQTVRADAQYDAELRQAAADALAGAHPLMWAEYYAAPTYHRPDKYENAIRYARAALDADREGSVHARAKGVLRQAYTGRARTELEREPPNYWDAKAAVLGAVDASDSPEQSDELRELGLWTALGLHDHVAPTDPKGYAATYEVLKAVDRLAGESHMAALVRVNLAEASLTTGHYAEAYQSATAALTDRRFPTRYPLAMRFIALAALELSGRTAEAARAYAEADKVLETTPAGAEDWRYGGTRSYIARSPLSGERKTRLLGLLDRVDGRQ